MTGPVSGARSRSIRSFSKALTAQPWPVSPTCRKLTAGLWPIMSTAWRSALLTVRSVSAYGSLTRRSKEPCRTCRRLRAQARPSWRQSSELRRPVPSSPICARTRKRSISARRATPCRSHAKRSRLRSRPTKPAIDNARVIWRSPPILTASSLWSRSCPPATARSCAASSKAWPICAARSAGTPACLRSLQAPSGRTACLTLLSARFRPRPPARVRPSPARLRSFCERVWRLCSSSSPYWPS